jgi:predicted RNA-binding protein with PIN domain
VARFLVDGMNVIGARPTGWWRDRDAAVRILHARLAALAARDGDEFVLVLDGRPLPDLPETAAAPVAVAYARRRGRDAADDRLVELGAEAEAPGQVTAVTADRDLRERLAAHGVRAVGPGALWERFDALDTTGLDTTG